MPVFLASTLCANIAVSAQKLENFSIADAQLNFSPKLLLEQKVADGSECGTTKCPNRGDGRQDKAQESSKVTMPKDFSV